MPGTVDEEKFLSLQMENRQLKKEAVERDKKFKQTLARLARAQRKPRSARRWLPRPRALPAVPSRVHPLRLGSSLRNSARASSRRNAAS